MDEMNQQIIQNWNSVVSDKDQVFLLGDVAFCSKSRAKELVSQLNGTKILIMGNHDRQRSCKAWEEIGFDMVSPYPIIYKNYVVMMHEPPEYFNNDTPYFYVYGHVHSTPNYRDYTNHSACVSIERLNYTPALLEDVLSGKAYEHRKD